RLVPRHRQSADRAHRQGKRDHLLVRPVWWSPGSGSQYGDVEVRRNDAGHRCTLTHAVPCRRSLHGGRMPRRNYEQQQISDEDRAFVRSLVIHEDAAVLAFDKPSGLPVQTRNPDDRTLDRLMAAFAKSNGKRPRLVHRLDAQTSGVIVAAKTQPAAAALSA